MINGGCDLNNETDMVDLFQILVPIAMYFVKVAVHVTIWRNVS